MVYDGSDGVDDLRVEVSTLGKKKKKKKKKKTLTRPSVDSRSQMSRTVNGSHSGMR